MKSVEAMVWCDGRLFSGGLHSDIVEHDLHSGGIKVSVTKHEILFLDLFCFQKH